jgi:hypothetical protein
MIPTTADLLAHRNRVTDGALMDWADLSTLVEAPGKIATRRLRAHWHCDKTGVCRRLARLARFGLLDYSAGQGVYSIHRLGPVTDCDRQPADG